METDKTTLTISIPKNLIIRYFTERPERPGRPSNAKLTIDYIVREALLDHYYKLFTGGDTNGSRG